MLARNKIIQTVRETNSNLPEVEDGVETHAGTLIYCIQVLILCIVKGQFLMV